MATNRTHLGQRIATPGLILAANLWLGCAVRLELPPLSAGHPAHSGAPSSPSVLRPDPLDLDPAAAAGAPLDLSADAAAAPATRGDLALDEASQGYVDRLLAAYLEATGSLARDSVEGLEGRLDPLRTAAAALEDSPTVPDAVSAAAAAVGGAVPTPETDLEPLREAWKELSAAVLALVQLAPPTETVAPELVQAYCPMAGASWLQGTMDLQNPYFGQRMSSCGRIDDVLPARPPGKE